MVGEVVGEEVGEEGEVQEEEAGVEAEAVDEVLGEGVEGEEGFETFFMFYQTSIVLYCMLQTLINDCVLLKFQSYDINFQFD